MEFPYTVFLFFLNVQNRKQKTKNLRRLFFFIMKIKIDPLGLPLPSSTLRMSAYTGLTKRGREREQWLVVVARQAVNTTLQ